MGMSFFSGIHRANSIQNADKSLPISLRMGTVGQGYILTRHSFGLTLPSLIGNSKCPDIPHYPQVYRPVV